MQLLERLIRGRAPVRAGQGDPPSDGAAPVLTLLPSSVAPHQRGRAEFESVFGSIARAKRNWQLVAFGCLGVSGLLAGGLVTIATQSRITPYVVEVDRLGRAQSFGPAEQLRLTDRRVVTSQLATFVHDLRTVVGDPAAQSDLVRRAYAFVDQGAANFLNAYFADPTNDPRLLGRDQTRLVEITGVLPVPGPPMPGASAGVDAGAGGGRGTALPATWKVSWTETTIPRSLGGSPQVSAWEGYVTTQLAAPRDADRIALNPLGVYVTSVTWTRLTVRDVQPSEPSSQPATGPAQPQEVDLPRQNGRPDKPLLSFRGGGVRWQMGAAVGSGVASSAPSSRWRRSGGWRSAAPAG